MRLYFDKVDVMYFCANMASRTDLGFGCPLCKEFLRSNCNGWIRLETLSQHVIGLCCFSAHKKGRNERRAKNIWGQIMLVWRLRNRSIMSHNGQQGHNGQQRSRHHPVAHLRPEEPV